VRPRDLASEIYFRKLFCPVITDFSTLLYRFLSFSSTPVCSLDFLLGFCSEVELGSTPVGSPIPGHSLNSELSDLENLLKLIKTHPLGIIHIKPNVKHIMC